MTHSVLYDESYIADSAIPAYRVVVYGGIQDHVKLPGAQDAKGIAGISMHATTASGDTLLVRKAGRAHIMAASGNITPGVDLRIFDIRGMVDIQSAAWASGDGIVGVAEQASSASGDIITAWLEIHTAH